MSELALKIKDTSSCLAGNPSRILDQTPGRDVLGIIERGGGYIGTVVLPCARKFFDYAHFWLNHAHIYGCDREACDSGPR